MESRHYDTARRLRHWVEDWDGQSLAPAQEAAEGLERTLREARQQPLPEVDTLACLLDAAVVSFLHVIDAPKSPERTRLLERQAALASELCHHLTKGERQ